MQKWTCVFDNSSSPPEGVNFTSVSIQLHADVSLDTETNCNGQVAYHVLLGQINMKKHIIQIIQKCCLKIF